MKKISKKKLIQLLKNKGNKTYEELSKITGYHEKSLIRIHKQINLGTYSEIHKNSLRTPHNKISDKSRLELIKGFKEGEFKTKKEYYKYLQSKQIYYSYSFICKLVQKKRKTKGIKKESKFKKIKRKMIADNLLQYNNSRYSVITTKTIKHHEIISIVVEVKTLKSLYIIYKNKKYDIALQKEITSVKGNTKYN